MEEVGDIEFDQALEDEFEEVIENSQIFDGVSKTGPVKGRLPTDTRKGSLRREVEFSSYF